MWLSNHMMAMDTYHMFNDSLRYLYFAIRVIT